MSTETQTSFDGQQPTSEPQITDEMRQGPPVAPEFGADQNMTRDEAAILGPPDAEAVTSRADSARELIDAIHSQK